MAPPRNSPHDPEPTVTRLRPGDVDPSTGRRIPGKNSGVPRHLDGTPMTPEEIRAELEAEPDRPWHSRRIREKKPAAKAKAGSARGKPGPRGAPSWSGRALGQRTFAPVRIDTDITGFVLALTVWGWVVMPALRAEGNPAAAVRDVLRAKFFNRDDKGGWLP